MPGLITLNGAQFMLTKPSGKAIICGIVYKYNIVSGTLLLTARGRKYVFMNNDNKTIDNMLIWWHGL